VDLIARDGEVGSGNRVGKEGCERWVGNEFLVGDVERLNELRSSRLVPTYLHYASVNDTRR
jgi:hypothetical protein